MIEQLKTMEIKLYFILANTWLYLSFRICNRFVKLLFSRKVLYDQYK